MDNIYTKEFSESFLDKVIIESIKETIVLQNPNATSWTMLKIKSKLESEIKRRELLKNKQNGQNR